MITFKDGDLVEWRNRWGDCQLFIVMGEVPKNRYETILKGTVLYDAFCLTRDAGRVTELVIDTQNDSCWRILA